MAPCSRRIQYPGAQTRNPCHGDLSKIKRSAQEFPLKQILAEGTRSQVVGPPFLKYSVCFAQVDCWYKKAAVNQMEIFYLHQRVNCGATGLLLLINAITWYKLP